MRGCIGALVAIEALAARVVRHAESAAVRDPRFSPVRSNELLLLAVSISALEPLRPLPLTGGALVARAGGHIDAADHLGATLGALTAGTVLLPAVGATQTLALVALLDGAIGLVWLLRWGGRRSS